ncbi:MAG: porin [Acidobacteriota bacterium]
MLTCGLWGEEDNRGEKKSQVMEWSGYIQTQFTHSTQATDSFQMRRARLKLIGEITDSIFYKLQLSAKGTPVLLDAQIDIKFSPYASLRFGQFKVPFSLENLTSSSSLDFINRSPSVENLCPGRDIGSSGRDIGVLIYGKAAHIEYSLGVFNGSGKNRLDNNEHKDLSGRLVCSPFNSLSLGFSYYSGKHNRNEAQPAAKKNRKGLELKYVKGRFSLKSEFILAQDKELERQGLYVQGAYFFRPKKTEFLIRYSHLDNQKHQKGEYHKIINLGWNRHISEKTKFQINLEFHNQEPFPGRYIVLMALFQAGF